jgi:Domain of unknown function (DUF4845)
MSVRRRQGGLTMIGFLFVAAVVVVVALIGFRVTPAYIEYFSVQKGLEQALQEVKDPTAVADVRRAFQMRVDAGYIESVSGRDIEITKERNQITASVSWTRKLPLISNVSLLIEFEASATR